MECNHTVTNHTHLQYMINGYGLTSVSFLGAMADLGILEWEKSYSYALMVDDLLLCVVVEEVNLPSSINKQIIFPWGLIISH